MTDAHAQTDIVLVGGGHAHVHVLVALARQPDVRVTLVARDLMSPYSGMLPGLVMGLYAHGDAHIDLAGLAAATGARLVHGEAVALERAGKRLRLADGSALPYGLVSLDVGVTPDLAAIRDAALHGISVKPIGAFLEKFEALRLACRKADGPRRIAVIGGGAGGVELLLAVRARLVAEADAGARGGFSFALVTAEDILPSHNARVADAFRRILRERDVALHERRRVAALARDAILLADGGCIDADAVLLTTQAAAPPWFRDTGLALDPKGFLAIGPTLQSQNDPDVFAAGDCAALIETPREKAGVYAVRAGPPLAQNIMRRARGEALVKWTPQARHLSLISAGGRYAVASYGPFKAEGAWVWWVKDRIDRRWMRTYQRIQPQRPAL